MPHALNWIKCNNNNNLRLIMIKTNSSTLHTVYNIQQYATQGSNDTTHRLSRRSAATTRFSPEGIGCQKQTAPKFCQHPISWAFTSPAFTRWRHLSTHRWTGLLLIYRPRKDERLSWPSGPVKKNRSRPRITFVTPFLSVTINCTVKNFSAKTWTNFDG